jgi:putative transposase
VPTALTGDAAKDRFAEVARLFAIAPRLNFHSDHGSQYRIRSHRQILEAADILLSMSDAPTPTTTLGPNRHEPLKNEMLQVGSFVNDTDSRIEIFDFIEFYYNHRREHSSLSYQTPAQFEAKTNLSINPNLVQKSVTLHITTSGARN